MTNQRPPTDDVPRRPRVVAFSDDEYTFWSVLWRDQVLTLRAPRTRHIFERIMALETDEDTKNTPLAKVPYEFFGLRYATDVEVDGWIRGHDKPSDKPIQWPPPDFNAPR